MSPHHSSQPTPEGVTNDSLRRLNEMSCPAGYEPAMSCPASYSMLAPRFGLEARLRRVCPELPEQHGQCGIPVATWAITSYGTSNPNAAHNSSASVHNPTNTLPQGTDPSYCRYAVLSIHASHPDCQLRQPQGTPSLTARRPVSLTSKATCHQLLHAVETHAHISTCTASKPAIAHT